MDNRLEGLWQWVTAILGKKPYEIVALSNDASPRRYFALPREGIVAVDTPLPTEQNVAFINISRTLHEYGLNVPQVFRHDLKPGYMLISDLGRRTYLSELTSITAHKLYGDALSALKKLQEIPRDAFANHHLEVFDDSFVFRELRSWQEWFVEKYLQIELTSQEQTLLENTYRLLANNNAEQPQVLVHRDYHSRNLMICDHYNPGIIDFQDAVWGAVTYDLVSLLRDCYIDWPPEQVGKWVANFQQQLQDSKRIPAVSQEQFLRWFDLMGVQRHLKALFIFARLDLLYKKPGYLKDIPRTLSYVTAICKRYKELNDLAQFIRNKVMPAMPTEMKKVVSA